MQVVGHVWIHCNSHCVAQCNLKSSVMSHYVVWIAAPAPCQWLWSHRVCLNKYFITLRRRRGGVQTVRGREIITMQHNEICTEGEKKETRSSRKDTSIYSTLSSGLRLFIVYELQKPCCQCSFFLTHLKTQYHEIIQENPGTWCKLKCCRVIWVSHDLLWEIATCWRTSDDLRSFSSSWYAVQTNSVTM